MNDMLNMDNMTPEQVRKLLKKLQARAYEQTPEGKAKRAATIASRKSPYARGCGPNASRAKSFKPAQA